MENSIFPTLSMRAIAQARPVTGFAFIIPVVQIAVFKALLRSGIKN